MLAPICENVPVLGTEWLSGHLSLLVCLFHLGCAWTGFMSNRGRQNVASYLALDLGLDWRKVAYPITALYLMLCIRRDACFLHQS